MQKFSKFPKIVMFCGFVYAYLVPLCAFFFCVFILSKCGIWDGIFRIETFYQKNRFCVRIIFRKFAQ